MPQVAPPSSRPCAAANVMRFRSAMSRVRSMGRNIGIMFSRRMNQRATGFANTSDRVK